ncbi:MAG: Csa1 family protein [Sarcina sp.]
MTQAIGCIGSSEKKILNKFNDFITMFPTKDLTTLYDKEGGVSITNGKKLDDVDIEEYDSGQWCISSYVTENMNDEEKISSSGVVLFFYKDEKKAEGDFIVQEGQKEEKYSIYYDEKGIHLINEDVPKEVKEKLADFKMLFEVVSLDKDYFNSLENTKVIEVKQAGKYGVNYKLNSDDMNIKKIKEVYPNLKVDEKNCKIELYSTGELWNTIGSADLNFDLDEKGDTSLSASLGFQRSEI